MSDTAIKPPVPRVYQGSRHERPAVLARRCGGKSALVVVLDRR